MANCLSSAENYQATYKTISLECRILLIALKNTLAQNDKIYRSAEAQKILKIKRNEKEDEAEMAMTLWS